MKTLSEVLTYKNDYIIHEFLRKNKNLQLSFNQAELVFEDLKRFLWLLAFFKEKEQINQRENLTDISISDSMIVIDEMWHEFILVTEHYTEFCQIYFNRYIHHPPQMSKHKRNLKSMTMDQCNEIFIVELIEVVFKYLGKDVAVRWFDTYKNLGPDIILEKENLYT